jgi:hypothetical protein
MNGDTHCYLCDGTGVQVTYSAEAKAQMAAEAQWASDAHYRKVGGFSSFDNMIRRPCREATETTEYRKDGDEAYEEARRADRAAARKFEDRLTFWVGTGLADMIEAQGAERRAAEAAAIKEFKS